MVPLRISLQVDTTSNHMSKALKPIPNIYTYIYVQLEFLHCGMYIYICILSSSRGHAFQNSHEVWKLMSY